MNKYMEYDEKRARVMRLMCGCPMCRAVEKNGGHWVKPKTLWQKFIDLWIKK